MTTADLIRFAASGAAVAALVLLCWMLGFRAHAALGGEADVRAIAAREAPSAAITDMVLDKDGRAAIVWFADGRTLILRTMGERTATRLSAASAVKFKIRGDGALYAAAADFTFPPLLLRAGPGGLPKRLTETVRADRKETA